MGIHLLYRSDLPDMPVVASFFEEFQGIEDANVAAVKIDEFCSGLLGERFFLHRDLIDELMRHLISLPPPACPDKLAVLGKVVANLHNRNPQPRVGAEHLADNALQYQRLDWFDVLASQYPNELRVYVSDHAEHWNAWVSNLNTTPTTLTKLAQFVADTPLNELGHLDAYVVLALDPICRVSPDIIGRVCPPEFFGRLGGSQFSDVEVKRAASGLFRAGLRQVVVGGVQTGVGASTDKPKL